jgi:hypothetical protein
LLSAGVRKIEINRDQPAKRRKIARETAKVVAYNLAGNRVSTFASVQSAAGAFENRRVVHE